VELEIYLNDIEAFKNLIQFLPHWKRCPPFIFSSHILGVLYEVRKVYFCGEHVCLALWPGIVWIFGQVFLENNLKLKLNYDRQSVSLCQAPIGTRNQFFFLLEIFFKQLWVCYFVAPSLMRGRVCNLLLLLVLASIVLLVSESRGTNLMLSIPDFQPYSSVMNRDLHVASWTSYIYSELFFRCYN
jgi:hypothetical protein